MDEQENDDDHNGDVDPNTTYQNELKCQKNKKR